MERLSGLDAGFLSLETPTAHMHVASVVVVDPGADRAWGHAQVVELIERRLGRLAPFRRRLVEVPFGLHHPVWVEDPALDVAAHVHRAALPAPGGRRELETFAAEVVGRPLDRDRPLWELHVVEGLEDGAVALITKIHHAAVDGVLGAELMAALLDLAPTVEGEEPVGPPPAETVPGDPEMLAYALRSWPAQPGAAVSVARRAVALIGELRQHNREASGAAPPPVFGAPRTFFNTMLSPRREVATAELSLDEARRVGAALGGTVNDVVLAVCAGGLRRWLTEHGDPGAEDLVALVPVSVRAGAGEPSGNRLSAMLVSLATTVDDPVERLVAIRAAATRAKSQQALVGPDLLTQLTGLAPPALAARAVRLSANLRLWERLPRPLCNVVVSNVAGAPVPLWCAGAPVRAMWPLGPITDGIGLNITVLSYLDVLHVGLVGCPGVTTGLDRLGGHLVDAAGELSKTADRANAPSRPARRARRARADRDP